MSQVVHALGSFIHHLEAVRWQALGIASGFHLLRLLLRTRAWRNIVAAAYPETRVRWRSILGAYLAGVGVNGITPARGGDLLKLYLAKRRVEGSTYTTLGATLFPETLFDLVAALGLLGWTLSLGVLPSLDALPNLPSIDWSWPFRHPSLAAAIGGILAVALVAVGIWTVRRVAEFKRRVAQGLAILRDRPRYLRAVVSWQALSWCCRVATVFYALRAFGVPATLHNALLVVVAQSLSTVLPLTPGGAGTEQGLLVYLFKGKVATTGLLSFSVGLHVAIVVINGLLGFAAIAVMLRTLRWRRAIGGDETATQPDAPR